VTTLRRRLVILTVLSLASACQRTPPDPAATHMNGERLFSVRSATAHANLLGEGRLSVVLANFEYECFHDVHRLPGEYQVISMNLAAGRGEAIGQYIAGSYDALGASSQASAYLAVTSRLDGGLAASVPSLAGSVKITEVTGARVAGEYSVTLENGSRVHGAFDARLCPRSR